LHTTRTATVLAQTERRITAGNARLELVSGHIF
jgi:hypothetical protein